MNWIDRKLDELLEQGVGVRGVADEVLRTALEEARTQGAQEALAKVEEWVKFTTSDTHDVGYHYWGGDYEPSTVELFELTRCLNEKLESKIKHLQQLKDNKEV